jgi:hypothetical protein
MNKKNTDEKWKQLQLVMLLSKYSRIKYFWYNTEERFLNWEKRVCYGYIIYSVFHKSIRDLEAWPCSSKPTYKR